MSAFISELPAQPLMPEAVTTAQYLARAIEAIDLQLGHGYASEHPQLIAAFVQTCAIDSVAGTLEREINQLTETIAQAIRESA
jgi:hypothetical protein